MSAHLDIRDLVVTKNARTVLDRVSLATAGGAFIGIVGPNGAGKSTLLRAIAGLEHAVSGDVFIDGAPVASLTSRERARRLAFLPQLREIHWGVAAERVVALGRFAYGAPDRLGDADKAAVERAVAATDLSALRTRAVTTLSGGERARVHLARALAAEAPILLADEPTAALDPRHALEVMTLLKAKADAGGLVLAALHELELASRFCSRVVALEEGAVHADGPPFEALSDDVIAKVFRVSAERIGDGSAAPIRLTLT